MNHASRNLTPVMTYQHNIKQGLTNPNFNIHQYRKYERILGSNIALGIDLEIDIENWNKRKEI